MLEAYKAKWHAFVKSVQGTGPLGVAHEAVKITNNDYAAHNTIMCYAYVLTLAARGKKTISLLDWGGGIGHYYLISRALLPDMGIEYHCKDVPILCEYGRTLFAKANFYEGDTCLERTYDLVLVSASLQYVETWCSTLRDLTSVTGEFLYVTRLPIVHRVKSFVALQRSYKYGYNTEYLGWFLNREEFLNCLLGTGKMKLVREFLIAERPLVHEAPEQGEYRGFLFRRIPCKEVGDL